MEKKLPEVRHPPPRKPSPSTVPAPISRSPPCPVARKAPKSLLSLCVARLGCFLEDLIDEIDLIAPILPETVKIQLVAIARRRGLLCDKVLVSLADEAWEILDVSGSDVTDRGICRAVKVCSNLKAVDVSCCSSLTANSIRAIVEHCPALQTLRCGGTLLSNKAARLTLPFLLPGLNPSKQVEESWEELDAVTVATGAQELRWIVWPSIDEESRKTVELECPRVIVLPAREPKKAAALAVPREALPGCALDEQIVEDIAPSTWDVRSSHSHHTALVAASDCDPELSMAERFRLAFASRDERLAPKRAKNSRQNERRDRRQWLDSSLESRARHLADNYLCKKS